MKHYSQKDGKVIVNLNHFRNGIQHIECDYLLGCDGFNSQTRKIMGIEMKGNQ